MSLYVPSTAAEAWLSEQEGPITQTTLQQAFAAGYGQAGRDDLGLLWVSRYYGSIDRIAAALAFDAGRKHAARDGAGMRPASD